ncbi:MAG: MXAN_5808 family serine peptidase [Myxococcota bacterium]
MNLRRLWKPALAFGAVIAAFSLTVALDRNGLEVDIDGSRRAQAARNQDPYDLTRLQVLNRTVLEVKDHYVEPERIDWQRMFLAGLNAIQRAIAPVIIRYEEGAPELTVQIGGARESFPARAESPWALAQAYRSVFAFLQSHLDDEEIELRDVEYTAVNGMLRTLDPHTVLLTPDVFEEMQMSTRGQFGGLGIVISIRDGSLTIIRPMPGTPADRAGLQRGDRIVKINDESTLNMPLSEAVDRLRGAPGSTVNVFISRRRPSGEWSSPRRVQLERAVIRIESVEHRMLADGIGYVSINNFQGNTHEDLRRALADLHRDGLRGLVLDLRDNPGGLLDQAVRVTDTFLTSGTIVTTASNDPRQRDEKFARQEGTEPDFPMVVLVNGASASASEIVAGALKNHDRALIVGQRTFGKGSVQVLNNFQDGSALKLTVAQYLTPGDVSIQGVGIVPDIGIDPMTVDREDPDLDVDPESFLREADLRSALTNERAREDMRPSVVLRYYLNGEMRQQLREADPRDTENEEEDEFLTRFSQRLLARATRSGRRELLAELAPVVEETRRQEMGKAVAELQRIGVDWSAGEDRGASTVSVAVSTDRAENVGVAGQPFSLAVRVTNTGSAPLFQLRATTKSDNRLFDDRELIFGRLDPGATREWTTTLGVCTTDNDRRLCRLPWDTADRADGVRIEFAEAHGHAPPAAEIRTRVEAVRRPRFAYALQVADDLDGNGDGRLQRGERASLTLRVKNVGQGPSHETHANLRNLSGPGLLLQAGRFRIDDMAPGEERAVRFTFEVREDFAPDEAELEVGVADADLRVGVSETVLVPIAEAGAAPERASGQVTLRAGATLHATPDGDAPAIGEVTGGALGVVRDARLGDWLRVRPDADAAPLWVPASAALDSGGGGRIAFAYPKAPPRLDVDAGGVRVTQADTLQLRGRATDDDAVRDLYIFAGARKVFYQANASGGAVEFDAEIPLHAGLNYITVFARENDDVVSRQLLVVRRDGPNGELLETPRFDDDVFGSVHEE